MYQQEWDFNEQKKVERQISTNAPIELALQKMIVGSIDVKRAPFFDDRTGVDYWVECIGGARIGVDVKSRLEDFSVKPRPFDDLCLETWSDIESRKVGWTRDCRKRCDYILWVWNDTFRFYLSPFRQLCGVMIHNWEEWVQRYRVEKQPQTGGWTSECVFVPRKLVERKISERANVIIKPDDIPPF